MVSAGLGLRLRDVSVHRTRPRGGRTCVLESLSLELGAGEHLALVGPNGAGKTTLLLALVGAVEFEGTISYGETLLGPGTLRDLRSRIGFVFAEAADQLFTDSVYDEVAFGPRQDGVPDSVLRERVEQALGAVGLRGFEERRPDALSLGEQRRLALAAAVARDAAVVLCDEPTAGLDPVARRSVVSTLGALKQTVVVATHDLPAAREIARRVALLRAGRVVAEGSDEMLDDPVLLERAGLV